MESQSPTRIIMIGGQTGAGKSSIALGIAQRWGGEIVNADSQQVYRHLDIGTAKPTPDEQALVPHHLFDILDPHEQMDAGRFVEHADAAIDDIIGRGALPVVVGGTGLYLEALYRGLADIPTVPEEVRRALDEALARDGLPSLRARLEAVDPTYAATISERDTQRILRALEVYQATGVPLSEYHRRHRAATPRYRALRIALLEDRRVLDERLTGRVRAMVEGGLVDEVRALLDRGISPHSKALQTMGYRQVVDLLAGASSHEATIAAIVTVHRQYAKRQRTWFANRSGFTIVSPRDRRAIDDLVARFVHDTLEPSSDRPADQVP